jgi:regulator of PEP synthase PpsR (kinase-PPPase family)
MKQSQRKQIVAIEYTLAHDDGVLPQDWKACDILLLGVSRAGKTPVAMYLGVMGWKVANAPLTPEVALPRQIGDVERHRIVGLTIRHEQLCDHRAWREQRFGLHFSAAYADPESIGEELTFSAEMFRHAGYAVIDVTDKPIEQIAREVLAHVQR